jgi:lactose/L-arabinose transport system substrate-binding protein
MKRRQFLECSAALGAGLLLSSRTPFSAAAAERPRTNIPAVFTFSTWGDYRFYKDGFQRMQKAYPRYASVQFNNQQVPSSDVLRERLLTGYVAKAWNSMPDVCEVGNPDVPRLASAGVLVDLTDRIKPYTKDLAPAVLQTVSYKGRVMACPWRPNTAMIYYRHDVWSQAGVKADAINLWSDYIAAGKKIASHKFADGVKRYIMNRDATPGFMIDLLTQQGGQLFDPHTGKLLIDTDPRFRRAFETQVAMYRSGIGIQINGFSPAWFQALKQGIVSSYIAENWMDQILEENMPDTAGKWRTMEYPAFVPGGGRDALGGAAVVVAINKPGLDKDLVWRFMQHSFFDTPVTVSLYNTWHLVPAYLAAESSPDLLYNRPVPFYGGQNQGALDRKIQKHAFTQVYTPQFALATQYISTALAEAVAGKESVTAAIKKAAAKIRAAGTS